jgi:hypothetical protein
VGKSLHDSCRHDQGCIAILIEVPLLSSALALDRCGLGIGMHAPLGVGG